MIQRPPMSHSQLKPLNRFTLAVNGTRRSFDNSLPLLAALAHQPKSVGSAAHYGGPSTN